MFFKKNKIEEIEEKVTYNYIITNVDKKMLHKIYNTEFSITEIYLQPYCNNTKIKVLELEHDKILGDIQEKDISEILKYNFKLGKICVSMKINDEGLQEYEGEVYFETYVKKR